jgi:hypothetical protein
MPSRANSSARRRKASSRSRLPAKEGAEAFPGSFLGSRLTFVFKVSFF